MGELHRVETIEALRKQVREWRDQGLRIALVPTMGALHAGHISLITLAKKHSERVITSIFVNPTQFGEDEDFSRYPRTQDDDFRKISSAKGDLLYMPDIKTMYPDGFATRVEIDGLSEIMEGAARPGHFHGVTQIVCKLFNQAAPDVAIFGEKDWQQLVILRKMVEDLDMPMRILSAPIARDEYGLALSSRNAYLSKEGLETARKLNQILASSAAEIAKGSASEEICESAKDSLLKIGFEKIDYFECREAHSLKRAFGPRAQKPIRLFVAARLEGVRLLDNFAVS